MREFPCLKALTFKQNYKLAGLHELIKTDNNIRNEKIQNSLILKFDVLFNLEYALFIIC